jgi:hypothetical protein
VGCEIEEGRKAQGARLREKRKAFVSCPWFAAKKMENRVRHLAPCTFTPGFFVFLPFILFTSQPIFVKSGKSIFF